MTPEAPSERRVGRMFDSLVERYDIVNSALSLGLDRRWRRATVRALPPGRSDPVLDVGCGLGELGGSLLGERRVVGVDLSARMLEGARLRTDGRMPLVRGSALALPFGEEAFGCVISGFVLRNVGDLPRAFAEMARVVRPGGSLALVDITGPREPLRRRLFDVYFRTVAPFLGWMVGKGEAYRYLARSPAQLPDPMIVSRMLERAGFRSVGSEPLSLGAVTLWTAIRSPVMDADPGSG